MSRLSLVACLLAAASSACSRSPRPDAALPSSAAPDAPSNARTCMTQSTEQYPPRADSVAIAGDHVSLCFGAGRERSCWRADVAAKSFEPVAVAPPRAEPKPATAVARADGSTRLCAPRGAPCTTIATPGAIKQPDWVGVSDDLSTLAIPDSSTLRIYDAATGRLRATIHGWPDSPMGGDAFNSSPTFAAPGLMIVWYAWTPVSEQGRIFDLSGTQLAVVGKDFWSIDPDHNSWRLDDGAWAIKNEANSVAVVDVARPNALATYDITALLALPRPPPDADTHLLDVMAIAGTAKRLVIVTAENPPTIGVLDRETGKLEKLDPPRCPHE